MAEFKFPVLSVRKQTLDLDIPQFLWKDVSDKQVDGVLLVVYTMGNTMPEVLL